MNSIAVVVADSDRLFSEALALALSDYPGLAVSEQRPLTGPDLVLTAIEENPQVVVADYWLREMLGPAAAVAISAANRKARVILLPWPYGPREVAYAFAAGAAGLVPKSAALDEVVVAVGKVAAGEERVCPEEVQQIARNLGQSHVEAALTWERLRTLTYREFQILNLLGSGGTLAEVAAGLSIRPSTAQTHLHRILEKTGTSTRHQAAALARSYGVAPP